MDVKRKIPLGNKDNETVLQVKESSELMTFLLNNLPKKNKNNIKTLLKEKQVSVDNQCVSQYNFLLQPGNTVKIRWDKVPIEKQYRGISIIYEDNDLIVIDKHHGLLSIATDIQKTKTAYSMLSNHVKKQNSKNKIFVVHRLDKDTSGLMMFAKSQKVQEILQGSWHHSVLEKTYLALVEGVVNEKQGTITSYLKEGKTLMVHSSQNPAAGEKAITHYEVLKQVQKFALLKVNIETGKKNQIRVHLKDIGHPIVGDKKYGAKSNPIARLGLHAWVLAFIHPVTGQELRFETQIPRKFTRLV